MREMNTRLRLALTRSFSDRMESISRVGHGAYSRAYENAQTLLICEIFMSLQTCVSWDSITWE